MTPQRWQQIEPLLDRARDMEPSEQAAFLARACGTDAAMRAELEALLSFGEAAEQFLEAPAMEVAAERLAAYQARAGQSPALLKPGIMLGGRYLIEKELEPGGMAIVFIARDNRLYDKPVVIKVLPEDLIGTDQKTWFEDRFKEEIAALARIEHPGVVRALDVGRLADGRTYLVMQYVDGPTLRSLIPPRGMELETVARVISKIGQALAAAHEQGVVHGDLKPENIMLELRGGDEHVKLVDFGMATVLQTPTALQGAYLAGTLDYMAHELLQCKAVPASDIYALGVIAYEMVTGRLPFNPGTPSDLAELQRAEVGLKPCDARPELSEAAQAVILKALAFVPRDRYLDVQVFSRELERAILNPAQSLILSVPFVALTFGLTILISQRFLSATPDVAGLSITAALILLCLLAVSPFTQTGQRRLKRGFSRIGLKLQLHGWRRTVFTIAVLLIVSLFYSSLPAIARIYNNRAAHFQRARNLSSAVRNYERAIHLDPGGAEAHYNLASAYEDMLLVDNAVAEYQASMRADPAFYYAYNNLARLYIVSRKDYAGALKIINAALDFKPHETSTRYTLLKNRGWAHFGLDLYDLAVEDLAEALRWRHDGAAAHCLLAQVFEGQKKPEIATKEWEACIAYSPGQKDVEASWLSLAQVKLRRLKDAGM